MRGSHLEPPSNTNHSWAALVRSKPHRLYPKIAHHLRLSRRLGRSQMLHWIIRPCQGSQHERHSAAQKHLALTVARIPKGEKW